MNLLLAIITAHADSRKLFIEVARNSWLQKCPVDYKFVYGCGGNREPEVDELFFDCGDSYGKMVLKDKALFQWALERDYDFVFRCCDDTFVFPKRLLNSDLEEYDYAGHIMGKGPWGDGHMHGGCGIWFSRKTMTRLIEAPWYRHVGSYTTSGNTVISEAEVQLASEKEDGYIDDIWMGEVLQGQLPWGHKERYQNGLYAAQGIKMHDDKRFVDLMTQSNQDTNSVIGIHSHTIENLREMIYGL